VASAVRSLAIGGLPVIILSESVSPLEVAWVPLLEDVSDLVIGDTEGMNEAEGLELWERIASGSDATDFRDLQWARLIDWRRAMASWFDRREERTLLGAIRAVTVRTGDGPGARLKGRLLLGWLGSRLGWDPDGAVSMNLETGGGTDAPLIESVELDFGADRPRLRWRRLVFEQAIVIEEGDDSRALFRLNQSKTHRSGAVVSLIQRYGSGIVAREAMRFAHLLVERGGA
jgi:glucose-6-phosphate dehydrogenase assembly protein OpcA